MSLLDGKTQSNCTAIPQPIARTRSSTTSAPCTDAVSGPGVVAGSPARYSSSWRITRAHSFFPVLLSAIFLAAVRSAKRLPLVQVSLISSDGKWVFAKTQNQPFWLPCTPTKTGITTSSLPSGKVGLTPHSSATVTTQKTTSA